MRILLALGFVAVASATAGAQLGRSGWSLQTGASRDANVLWIGPGYSAPQPMDTASRPRRERRMTLAENPYVRPGDSARALGPGELGSGASSNPYAALGTARPHVAVNPYYVTSLDDPRDRIVDDGRPVVLEANPYLY